MQKGISNTLNLCKVGVLTNDYNHTIDFTNKANQINYFTNKKLMAVSGNYILDSNRTSYLVNLSYVDLSQVDYMFCTGPDNKTYYYFINEVVYKTKSTTILYVELDVFQTFMFDFTIKNSFVDRCHVPRWNSDGTPKIEIEPEDLQLSAMEIKERKAVYNYAGSGSYIITSTEPLGAIENRRRFNNYNGIGGPGESEGDWSQGYMSAKGFRFLKGWEGYGMYPYNDGFGNNTVCYGITKNSFPTEFNMLSNKAPVSEPEGAEVSYNVSSVFGLKIIDRCIELGITSVNQFDSLMDLVYNAGPGVVLNDNSLMNAIKSKDLTKIKNTWETFYITANGNIVDSLRTRRKQEADIFLNSNYVYRPIAIYDSNRKIIGTVTDNNGNGWLPEINEDNDNNLPLTVKNSLGVGYKPTSGTITATFPTYPSGSPHSGIDIANNQGTKIYAWKSGTVRLAGTPAGYGLGIIIDHDDKKSTAIYGHSSYLYVKTGDHVKTGDLISLMGTTGNSTGNHLHFEIRPYGGSMSEAVNPWIGPKVGDKV